MTDHRNRRTFWPIWALVVAAAAPLLAVQSGAPLQQPGGASNPAASVRSIVSPEIHPDGRVTFRLLAPKATEVVVQGEWTPSRTPDRRGMTRDREGIWSVTVGPLVPSPYRYVFVIDDVPVVDPRNVSTAGGAASVQSLFVIPGVAADLSGETPVPHGAIRLVWYPSPLGGSRRMHVYTPPGYDRSGVSYPVLYLLHGASGSDDLWSTIGRAGFILDNLIAAGRARPMVVVMPDAHIPGAPSDVLPLSAADDQYARDFFGGVMPYVEGQLRVLVEPRARALAGLSMGGAQSLLILLSAPDK